MIIGKSKEMFYNEKGITPGKKFKDIAGTEELKVQKSRNFFFLLGTSANPSSRHKNHKTTIVNRRKKKGRNRKFQDIVMEWLYSRVFKTKAKHVKETRQRMESCECNYTFDSFLDNFSLLISFDSR